MKTKEELKVLKEEVETVSKKLHELTEEELAEVSGGVGPILNLKFQRPGQSIINVTASSDNIEQTEQTGERREGKTFIFPGGGIIG